MATEIHLVVADDHPIVRKGLREVIEEELDLKVQGEAEDGQTALSLIQKLQPHIAVLDLDMPKLDGFAVAAEVRRLNLSTELIFLTMHSEVDLLRRALDMGAKGYVVKESALIDIVNAIRSVAAGRSFVSSSMTSALVERRAEMNLTGQSKSGLAALSPSERRILSMIADGKPTKQIAAELYIHPRTVETHRARICSKLNLAGANSLLRFALQRKSELLS